MYNINMKKYPPILASIQFFYYPQSENYNTREDYVSERMKILGEILEKIKPDLKKNNINSQIKFKLLGDKTFDKVVSLYFGFDGERPQLESDNSSIR